MPNLRSPATSCVRLELRPLPSPGITRLPRYYEPLRHPMPPGLSLAGVRLAIPGHDLGFPCCVRFPCVMPPPIPRCSNRMSSSLVSSGHISLPRYTSRVGLHGVHFEDCSAFTCVAACTRAPATNSWPAIRRLQPSRCLHDCSGCFRLERLAGWGLHPLEKRRLITAHGGSRHKDDRAQW